MATYNIKLTNTPAQITDGTKRAIIQSLNEKNFCWCDSLNMPDKTSYHFTHKLSVGTDVSIWIWNPSSDENDTLNISYTIVGE